MKKLLIFVLLLLTSCESKITNVNLENPKKNEIFKLSTKYTDYIWFIEEYTNYFDKRVGMWWPKGVGKTEEDYSWYKKMGYSLIFSKYSYDPHYGHYETINNVYTQTEKIMYATFRDYLDEVINHMTALGEDCSGITNFYIDEAIENYYRHPGSISSFSSTELITYANTLNTNYPGKKIIIGTSDLGEISAPPVGIGYDHTYKDPPGDIAIDPYEYLDVLNNTTNVMLMCDMYQYGGLDYWMDFINFYGNSNVAGIIINADDNEFYSQNTQSNDLFLVRREIDELWLYASSIGLEQDGIDRIKDFSYKAWETSWLNKRIERLYKYEYVWVGDGDPPIVFDRNDSGWLLQRIDRTSEKRTADRSYYNYSCPDNFAYSPDNYETFPVVFSD